MFGVFSVDDVSISSCVVDYVVCTFSGYGLAVKIDVCVVWTTSVVSIWSEVVSTLMDEVSWTAASVASVVILMSVGNCFVTADVWWSAGTVISLPPVVVSVVEDVADLLLYWFSYF